MLTRKVTKKILASAIFRVGFYQTEVKDRTEAKDIQATRGSDWWGVGGIAFTLGVKAPSPGVLSYDEPTNIFQTLDRTHWNEKIAGKVSPSLQSQRWVMLVLQLLEYYPKDRKKKGNDLIKQIVSEFKDVAKEEKPTLIMYKGTIKKVIM